MKNIKDLINDYLQKIHLAKSLLGKDNKGKPGDRPGYLELSGVPRPPSPKSPYHLLAENSFEGDDVNIKGKFRKT